MRPLYSFSVFLLFAACLYGQETTIVGIVRTPEGEPVLGANVYLKGTYDGASTDAEGGFSFSSALTGSQALAVSYLGYRDWEQVLDLAGVPVRIEVVLRPTAASLGEVIITAGAFEAGDQRKSVVLRPLDIVTTAGATADIAGALNTLPGTQTVGEEGQLFVRGGAAYETRTFIDGMQVQDPYGSSAPDLPARNRFSPFLFQGTLFSTGGYSAEYGQALSSALLLTTQDLAPQTVTGLSVMSVGLGLSHTQRWDRSSLAVSGDYSNLGPYVRLIRQQIDWKQAPSSLGGQFIFRRETSPTGMLKIQGNIQHSNLAMAYPDERDVTRTNSLSVGEDNSYLNASFREILGKRWSFFGGFAYSVNKEIIRERFALDDLEHSIHSRVRLNYQASESVQVKMGVEHLFHRFEERYSDPSGVPFPSFFTDHYTAAFAETDIHFSPRLLARLGNRLEYSSLLSAVNWAPRLSLAWKTGLVGQISLAYGNFYQTPDKEWLRFNRDLGFEQAEHYILNYQWEKDGRVARLEGYYKHYRNLVRFPAGAPQYSENTGQGYARGIDLFYRDRQTLRNVDFWVSYSFLDTKRQHRDFPVATMPYFASRHNLRLVYKQWFPTLTSSLGITYSLASSRPYQDPNTQGFNTGRTPAYQDLSVNLSYLTTLFGQFTIVYVSATNLPGFKQTFGYRFSTQPGEDGSFASLPIQPPARRFFFVGLFLSIAKDPVTISSFNN